jgi:hypothetical protein
VPTIIQAGPFTYRELDPESAGKVLASLRPMGFRFHTAKGEDAPTCLPPPDLSPCETTRDVRVAGDGFAVGRFANAGAWIDEAVAAGYGIIIFDPVPEIGGGQSIPLLATRHARYADAFTVGGASVHATGAPGNVLLAPQAWVDVAAPECPAGMVSTPEGCQMPSPGKPPAKTSSLGPVGLGLLLAAAAAGIYYVRKAP